MSWLSVPLGDVVEIKGGGTPSKANPRFWGGDIPWVSPKDMKRWEISDAEDKITAEAVSGSATNLIPENSILLVNRSGILKHTLPVGITRRQVAINQDIKALICGRRADPNYIARIVKAAEPTVLKWVRATTADNFSIDNLRELEIPLPPLDEQRRIAAILDKADALRRKRRHALETLDGLTQSIFLEMFGDPSTNRKGLGRGTISDLLTETQYGTSAKAGSVGAYPILRMGNITNSGRIDLEDMKWIDLNASERDKYTVRRGDIIFNRTNSVDLVGKTAVFDQDEPYAFAGYLVRARAKTEALPFYIVGYLNSAHGKATLRKMAKSIVGMANINAREMQSIPILIPDSRSAERYAEAIAAVRKHERRSQPLLATAEALFSSLQHRAFTGQL